MQTGSGENCERGTAAEGMEGVRSAGCSWCSGVELYGCRGASGRCVGTGGDGARFEPSRGASRSKLSVSAKTCRTSRDFAAETCPLAAARRPRHSIMMCCARAAVWGSVVLLLP